MNERVHWNTSGINSRLAVVELCGWHNKSGKATPTGQKIAKTEWDKLSTAAKRIIEKHGILK